MALPKSYNAFTIPSLYDDIELHCRLYFPRKSPKSTTRFVRGFSVFAHPYAPLGGSCEDPVVNLVGSTLLREGFVLATFNFRGAEDSPGHTSWSGKPELGDFVSIIAFMLCFIQAPGVLDYVTTSNRDHHLPPWLILGGYSYGSMIASHLPTLRTVQTLMTSLIEGSTELEISSRAHDLSKAFLGYAETQQQRGRSSLRVSDAQSPSSPSISIGGYESEAAGRKVSRESSRRSIDLDRVRHSVDKVRHKLLHRPSSGRDPEVILNSSPEDKAEDLPRLAHLLISPLLGIVSGFTTMFQKLEFERRNKAPGKGLTSEQMSLTERMTKNPTCVIYGTKDTFTSARKLRAWCEEMHRAPSSYFVYHEIVGAGHFWHEAGTESQMTDAITDWISAKLD